MQHTLSQQEFFERIIIPAHWGMAQQDIIFTLHNLEEQLILTSNCYAKDLGFKSFQNAMYKYPGYDYKREFDSFF